VGRSITRDIVLVVEVIDVKRVSLVEGQASFWDSGSHYVRLDGDRREVLSKERIQLVLGQFLPLIR